ncbi:thiamine pyrophosphate-binding protein [Cryobacterium melibiosiphilum]|uniref:Thiamine pyrophosphate-binding protein n=1 Tax=Cryobacterium melibiosiphilum TaxID=995039 RepID=A0A3A5M8J8_9MICO|nr:thiamine pyrophosphate-binding protein [Cryobacterium melibiosiphilum]RJT85293.1 thiamine pyrophosphate-binding protein [Cryobacterium melibiosiphilum]
MRVAEAVGRTLALLGVGHVFGVVGSGNFHVTNALISGGVTFTAARHENGAACMADAFARASGHVTALTVHQGCGLTNALTGIGEAAKSRTPVLVLAGETPGTDQTSNFWIDQAGVVAALGVRVERIHSAKTAVNDTIRAFRLARDQRRTVLLNLPLDVQEEEVAWSPDLVGELSPRMASGPSPDAVGRLADLLAGADRPVLVGGRGAFGAVEEIRRVAAISGALLTTSAVGRGLFHEDAWYLDVMGGFSTPVTAELIEGADLIVAFGASLNRWTTRSGALLRGSTVVQIDDTADAIGVHTPVALGIVGDCAQVAGLVAAELARREVQQVGYRTELVAGVIASGVRWRDVPFDDIDSASTVDPRALTIALDDMLPMERVVVPDGGNFNGYPAMFLQIPDEKGYCVPLAFQSIGLALPSAIGAALATPGRLAVAGIGDGGFMMSLVELDTAVRLHLGLVVIVYNDNAYGAEVHHFVHGGGSLETVEFPETDIAAIARGFGCRGVTVRSIADLVGVKSWLDGERSVPLVIDAKISSFPSWVLAHTFDEE